MPSERLLIRWLCRIYAVMLRAYPSDFRREYSREMMLAFRTQVRDTIPNRGTVGFVRFGLHIMWDWITTLFDETEGETMRKAVTLGVATVLLLFVDWLTFHDWREPHTVRDYLALCASLFVFVYLGLELLGRGHVNRSGGGTQ